MTSWPPGAELSAQGPRADFSASELAAAMREVGMRPDDLVFTHSNVGLFGWPAGGSRPTDVLPTVLEAYRTVLTRGTVSVPTFSYSFAQGQTYDPRTSPSVTGVFPEYVRQARDAHRSLDPMLSVAAIGTQAEGILSGLSEECLGPGSFWHRLIEADGFVCNLNIHAPSSLIHYAERILRVPYRYDKLFLGKIMDDGRPRPGRAIHFVGDLSDRLMDSHYSAIAETVKAWPYVRTARVGRGYIVGYRARPFLRDVLRELRLHPWILTRAGHEGIVPDKHLLSSPRAFSVQGHARGAFDRLADLSRAPRSLVGDGDDGVLRYLGASLPLVARTFGTGTRAGDWIVPERWTCDEATVRDLTGREVLSLRDHPLRVVEHSLPLDGIVPTPALLDHLHSHPTKDAIPNVSQPFHLRWGLACSRTERDRLVAASYAVRISSTFSRGVLSVGEVVVPGLDDREVWVAARTWSGTANDGTSGVVVAAEVARHLLEIGPLRYSYRVLFGPGTLGRIVYAVASGQHPPELGAIVVDRLACDGPIQVRGRVAGDGPFARTFGRLALDATDEGADDPLWPGVLAPVVSISRNGALHSATDLDTVARCDRKTLDLSVRYVRDMILRLDATL